MTSTQQPTFQVHAVVNRYCDIVRTNDAVQAVLTAIGNDRDPGADAWEIAYELCDTAHDMFGSSDHGPDDDLFLDGPGSDRFDRLQDALPEVVKNLTTGVPMIRRCRICTQEVTSSDPAVDYCQWCYYGGCIYGEQHKDLIHAIHETCRYSGLIADVAAAHTGGGCFVIEVRFVDRDDYVWLSLAEDYSGEGVEPNTWVIGQYGNEEQDPSNEGRFDPTPRTVTDAAARVLIHAIEGWKP